MENFPINTKLITKVVIAAFVFLALFVLSFKLFEEVDAGEVVVVQYPSGSIVAQKESGYMFQGFGKATHYKKSNQFWFLSAKDNQLAGLDSTENSLAATWNDGAGSKISGSVRYDMPITDAEIIKVHSIFGSQEAIERQLVKTNVEKAIFLTGPLMSSKESYSERRSDLISLIEDQANRGVYRTKTVEIDTKDPLTNEVKKEKVVQILENNGVQLRQEVSTITKYGLKLYNVAIKNIHYDKAVEEQIRTQQRSIMSVQSAIANARKAEQDAITAQKQGEANAATAKWEIEVEKARSVTKAQAERAVAQEQVQTAELNKRRDILIGEGQAAKKRLEMQANGALDQKLEAYKYVQAKWAEAFGTFTGNLVPLYSTGGTSRNGGFDFMEIMGAKAARDLNLDLSNKKN